MFGFRRKRLIAALLAAGLVGGGASVWAAARHYGGPGGDAFGPMGNLQRMHDELKLSAQQEELWKQAESVSRGAFRSLRANGREVREKMRAEIDKPGADLKQIAALGDQAREQMHAQMEATRKQVRAAWFAAYDSLNAEQKEQVRVAIRDGMDRRGHGGPGGMRGRHGRG